MLTTLAMRGEKSAWPSIPPQWLAPRDNMAMVGTPTKEKSAALPCAISPAIPSVSKLCGKHTQQLWPQSLGVLRTAHTNRKRRTVELADQAGPTFPAIEPTHVILGIICSLATAGYTQGHWNRPLHKCLPFQPLSLTSLITSSQASKLR